MAFRIEGKEMYPIFVFASRYDELPCEGRDWVITRLFGNLLKSHAELSNNLFLLCRRFGSANRMLGQTFVCFAVSNSRNKESCFSVLPRLVR